MLLEGGNGTRVIRAEGMGMCFGVVVCEFVATRAEKIADGGAVACRNPISLISRDLPKMSALHATEGMFA